MREIEFDEKEMCIAIKMFHEVFHQAIQEISKEDISIINKNIGKIGLLKLSGRQACLLLSATIFDYVQQLKEHNLAKKRPVQ